LHVFFSFSCFFASDAGEKISDEKKNDNDAEGGVDDDDEEEEKERCK